MNCTILEATDCAGRSGIPEGPGVVPYCLEPAMHDLVEPNHLVETYRTCNHWTVDVSYDGMASKHMLKTRHDFKQLRFMSAENMKNQRGKLVEICIL